MKKIVVVMCLLTLTTLISEAEAGGFLRARVRTRSVRQPVVLQQNVGCGYGLQSTANVYYNAAVQRQFIAPVYQPAPIVQSEVIRERVIQRDVQQFQQFQSFQSGYGAALDTGCLNGGCGSGFSAGLQFRRFR